ncbi:DUF4339 domain-containing protein [Colwellia sp. D2M02]|nr:GYF domain-containing protein [Colwellia sp. D2M02]MBU2892607.1 DUF4339 domain-containing protein [Colwellia sp. D2M02]
MKKWFFSDNGKVTAPLSQTEARAYLADNPTVYGWHPSFSQWKPVTCIPEFADIVPLPEQSLLVPKELTDKFLAKKQRLQTKLTSIDDSIKHTQSSLTKFEKQIEDYKALTQNLNDDVKGAIDNIEKKYSGLNKKIAQVKNAINIAEVEINDAIKSFDHRVNSNDVFMPSCHGTVKPAKSAPLTEVEVAQKASEAAQISKAKLAQAKLATPHKRVEAEKPVEEVAKKEAPKKEESVAKNKAEDESKANKEGFGMKNIMKSVFKGDKKVESSEEQPPMSMAERLKMAQNNT